MIRRTLLSGCLLLVLLSVPAGAVTLVQDGRPGVVVVTPDHPKEVAVYAAEELVRHVEKATGVALEVITESRAEGLEVGRVFVGDTEAARKQSLVPADLPMDAFVLRSVGNDLYVLGNGDGDDPLEMRANAKLGTLYGVYELLDRYVGVRWLWPGDLGTYVPHAGALVIDETLDETAGPALEFRRFRADRTWSAAKKFPPLMRRLGYSEDVLQAYAQDLKVYMKRHRLGDTEPKPFTGHYFRGWWTEHGEQHPEWFMMREDGTRGPNPDMLHERRYVEHVPMCVTSPGLQRYILEEAWDGTNGLRLGEVDVREFCQCEDCRAWDEPQPADYPAFAANLYQPQLASNRYARFWKVMLDKARERNPEVQVRTFLYWNYMPAPTIDIQFDGGVYGEFVPWGQPEVTYFPMRQEAYEWLKAQWLGWAERGVVMSYRPNYFHGGHVFPHLSTWQAGEFFKFAYDNRMVGFDQDMLIGHWAAKGPMLYVHMRLAVDPEMSIEQIREEYFSAFGPAAEQVEMYFDFWERYAADRPGDELRFMGKSGDAHVAYPQKVFRETEPLLEQAMEIARQSDRPEYGQRIEFLRAGFENARLVSLLMQGLDHGDVVEHPRRLEKTREVFKQLVDLRKANEHLYFADLVSAVRMENEQVGRMDSRLGMDVLMGAN